MAWTRDVTIGPYGATIRTKVTLLSQSRSANTSRVRVEVSIYKGAGSNNAYDASVSTSISGTVSASKTTSIDVPSNSWRYLWDQEFTITHGSDGKKSFSITGTLGPTGTSTFGDGGSATVSGTLPALILAPTAPTWGATDYQSADRVKISWSNNETARGPYDRIVVQRWARSTGEWWSRGSLSGTATSYTDSSLSQNNEHRWRVRAEGPGGVSAWVQGGTLGTVPAAPTGVSARKSGGDIRVVWTDNAATTNRTRTFLVEDNPDGSGWVSVGSIGGSATAWTHVAPDPSRTHQYRVRAQITSQITLTSSYSAASGTVQLQAPPLAPTILSPPDGEFIDGDKPVVFSWRHNPVDTTEQTAAEVNYWVDGAVSPVVLTTTTADNITETIVPPTARSVVEWRVRTKGADPDWGPWTPVAVAIMSTQPVVTVQFPTDQETLVTSRVTVDWAYQAGGTDPILAQAGWSVVLSDWATGTTLETRTGKSGTSVEMNTRLSNGTEYLLLVSARNGDGLWSETEVVHFTTDFPLPQPVIVHPEWDRDTAAVSIAFDVQNLAGRTTVDALDVERRDAGGDWVLIASGVGTTTTVTDRTPRIGLVEYRAISRTVLPTETVGPTGQAVWPFPARGAWVSGGAGFARVCTAMGAAASDEPDIEQATKRFAGVVQPVAFFGTGRSHQLSFTGKIPLPPNPTTVSTREEWEALLHEYGVVCYRDPMGRKRFGLLKVSFSQTGPMESVSLSVEEVQWAESVRRISDLELEAML